MADIVLKDYLGKDATYENVDAVAFHTSDGSLETFVRADSVSGGGLPEVTEADNEKVLKVQDGKWVVAENTGGVSSWDDLEDKPFFSTIGTMFEGIFQDESGTGQMMVEYAFDDGLHDGLTYTIMWNSVEYTSECVIIQGLPIIGNTDYILGDGDNGIPFIITIDTSGDMFGASAAVAMLLNPVVNGTYSCRITGEKIKYLDSKYLNLDDIEILPKVTIDDAGKFLRVGSDGTWIVEAIQDVSEVGL